MNYKALYRKYRPTSFSEVIGQNDVVTILKNSIVNKSFAHAYLFSGTKGTGKTSVAKILAKAINCENNVSGEACNQCSNCELINNSNDDIDILEIDGASNNGVEEIRSIKNNVSLLPMNLKYKVYIIDEVHMLTTSAFNALLKTLEEPPKHVVFIFATTEPYKIPETIISRCQWFQFEKINQIDLVKMFTKVLVSEGIKFESEALSELALLCDGSLRDGINSLEKVFNFSTEITLKSVKQLYNIISVEKKILLLSAILNQDMNQIVSTINELDDYLSDFKKFFVEMLSLIQDIIVYRLTNNIKISKELTLEQINKFSVVSTADLKMLLNLFENLIILNFDNSNLKVLMIARILKSFDRFEKYNLSDSNVAAEIKEEVQPAASNSESLVQESLGSEPLAQEPAIVEKQEPVAKKVEKEEVKIIDVPLEESMLKSVLNVIVQADKDVRKEAKANWAKIHQLIENNKFRNYSKIYLNTMITAACSNAIVIVCDNIIQANLINKNFCYQEYRNFLNFVLTKEYMVYALDKNQWKMIGQKYQLLLKDNLLPQAEAILIPAVVSRETKEVKSQVFSFLQDIFSEIEEI